MSDWYIDNEYIAEKEAQNKDWLEIKKKKRIYWTVFLLYLLSVMKKIIVPTLMLFWLFWFSQAAVLDDAVSWMNTNWLTIFKTIKDYQPNNYIRRDEAAKLFVKFAKIVKKDTYTKTAEECKFSDLNDAHADLKDIVVESCRMGIFQWANGKFMPRWSLTNEQAVTVLVRILVGNQSETGVSYWSENYYKKANEMWMLSQVNMTDRKILATRGNVSTLLFTNRDNRDLGLGTEPERIHGDLWEKFDLTFPSTWFNHKAISDMWGVDFSLDGRQMFYIYVQTISEYNEYWAPQAIYLEKNEKYRFYYSIFPIWYHDNDNPSKEMIQRINEISSIIQTFRIK